MHYSGQDIIKIAIINEQEGYEFYNMAARNTENIDLKQLFETLADQENQHREWLKATFMNIAANKASDLTDVTPPVSPGIFDTQKLNQLGAGELSSIHAAILLEKNSMDYYKKHAIDAENETAKSLFAKLADWESSHMDMLEKIYEFARDDWWEQQRFSPA